MLIPLFLAAAAATPPALPTAAAEPLLVTSTWLAQHLSDKGLIIFQIGDNASKPVYDEGHIPGAQFLNPFSELAAPRVQGALSLELPTPDSLKAMLERKGISNKSRIVLYWAKGYYSPTSRTLFTLEYAGLAGQVSILDGGLEHWKTEGRAVSTEVPTVTPGSFTLHLHPELVADAEYVRAHLADAKTRIVDARDTVFYTGERATRGKNGHIPGAASVYFGSIVDTTGRVLPLDDLRTVFRSGGVQDGQSVVTYCHIGQQATFTWFGARLLGITARLYDGSFEDWAAHADYPVETSPAKKPE
jgi:thiosulfate/3-mercaptopyruvate sulfurtransferase